MRPGAALEIGGRLHGLSHEGLAHYQGVENEVTEQDTDGEHHDGCVGSDLPRSGLGEIAEVHGSRDETVEEGHDDTCAYGQEDALAAVFLGYAVPSLLSGGDSVEDYGNDDQKHTGSKESDITAGPLLHIYYIIVDHTEHEGEAYTQREGDRHAGYGSRGTEKDVGCIENHSSEDYASKGGTVCLCKILQERPAFSTEGAHGECYQQGEEDHTDNIVPIEKFVPPALGCQLLGVAP